MTFPLFRYSPHRDFRPRADVLLLRGQNQGNSIQVTFTKYFHLRIVIVRLVNQILILNVCLLYISVLIKFRTCTFVTRLLGYEEYIFLSPWPCNSLATKNTRSLVKSSSSHYRLKIKVPNCQENPRPGHIRQHRRGMECFSMANELRSSRERGSLAHITSYSRLINFIAQSSPRASQFHQ